MGKALDYFIEGMNEKASQGRVRIGGEAVLEDLYNLAEAIKEDLDALESQRSEGETESKIE